MFEWNAGLSELVTLLASLYPSADDALRVLRDIRIDPATINLTGSSQNVWHRIVEQANIRDKTLALLDKATRDYPNIDLDTLACLLAPTSSDNRAPAPSTWRGSTLNRMTWEAITGSQPTFLPISFLESGMRASRSVAVVEAPEGLGTGFLIANNLFITNNHVIADPAAARGSVIKFNYQTTVEGNDEKTEMYKLNPDEPDGYFRWSPAKEDDWTIIRVCDKEANRRWGSLELGEVPAKPGDFVNIIQHPGGGPKHIALYHNVVVHADSSRVQYLTDTVPGSSGSPVFDSHWRVVALHSRSTTVPNKESHRAEYRNEGIPVRKLVQAINAS